MWLNQYDLSKIVIEHQKAKIQQKELERYLLSQTDPTIVFKEHEGGPLELLLINSVVSGVLNVELGDRSQIINELKKVMVKICKSSSTVNSENSEGTKQSVVDLMQ